MEQTNYRAIAIIGLGAILPDAPNVSRFWENIKQKRYSISDVVADRWDPALYYDADPRVPDKTYSKIGGWVREVVWDPVGWKLPIPPKVSQEMDEAQKWAIACAYEALTDYGYPKKKLDFDRTAVILGNAMAGEKHYLTSLRVFFPEFAKYLTNSDSFNRLSTETKELLLKEVHANLSESIPDINEDTMPGELANCMAGRIANLFNFHGPNYVCDAACASALAAISASVEGLIEGDFDTVITGGIDRNMGPSSYVKFAKIGALSATGTRPYADGADGFVMGEGAVIFILKRLADAERDGDKIYAVLRGIGGSSDGKGKGITAPNPIGQKFAIERAWKNADLSPSTVSLIEGHGTSTRVGDVAEVESLVAAFQSSNLTKGSVALGSVKSNIGHLKAAAGAAGLLKTVLALHYKVLPPSLGFNKPNPNIDFAHIPFYVNTELRDWAIDGIRRAGVSAFGFGGTNFHAVLEEYIPGRLTKTKQVTSVENVEKPPESRNISTNSNSTLKAPLRGALVLGASESKELLVKLEETYKKLLAGKTLANTAPLKSDLQAFERIAIDYQDQKDLLDKLQKAIKAMQSNNLGMWKALRAQGIFRGSGAKPKVAFLYTGQGSQYVNMLGQLAKIEPIIAQTFTETDQVMTPLLGKALTEYIFVDPTNEQLVKQAEKDLRQTSITQPAVLAVDLALTHLLESYGIKADMVMGHSLGEYGALVASQAMPFDDALAAVSARGKEMTKVSVLDNGKMAAVFAPLPEIEKAIKSITGYVVIANLNSNTQAVIGGDSQAITEVSTILKEAGFNVVDLPVSHAFHTKIVAPASEPLRQQLQRLHLQAPKIPMIANVTGEFYPSNASSKEMAAILSRQVAEPVQFVKGLNTLYQAGVRVFIEVGPKKALQGFVDDVFAQNTDVISLATNHPKIGDIASFNQALCGLYAAGFGYGVAEPINESVIMQNTTKNLVETNNSAKTPVKLNNISTDKYQQLGHLFAEVLDQALTIYGGSEVTSKRPVVISGAALGLPGTENIFDDENLGHILRGEQFIDVIPSKLRHSILDKNITRLVKSDSGEARFDTINNIADVIKLAARGGNFDLAKEFGISKERILALDRFTQLAIAVGIEALKDAGIPLVLSYKTTSKGTYLPDRWLLPESMRDDTGIIFASAFPGLDSLTADLSHYYTYHSKQEQLKRLEHIRERFSSEASETLLHELDQQISELKSTLSHHPYTFDRRFIFRILAMGHSQFAELIGARGPNTQINSACASTTQAISLAEDWLKAGRCKRVVIVAADDVTSDNLLEWIGSGFLASGAAATDEIVEEAALPFDRRRHGMILGMGAASVVVETPESVAQRGLQPICEVLGSVTANSAYHGTRLDVTHICQIMENMVSKVEQQFGLNRKQIAQQLLFVSHETYTPARGGSAAAEINALRYVFGAEADKIVIANTKGFTGHPMGAGVEDVVAIKALETGIVPPVANFKEVDPELGNLNLSKGGAYPIFYALRLGAGFGSQISMTLTHWIATTNHQRHSPEELGFNYRIIDANAWKNWLSTISKYSFPELEIVNRTLRVKDQGVAKAASQATVVKTVAAKPIETITKPGATQEVIKSEIPTIMPTVVASKVTAKATTVDEVKDKVLAIVAEKTGYPADMLDGELDMEADLGIDTVKQAEIFATIRQNYDIERETNLRLRDFPTLNKVVQFVYDRSPQLKEVSKEVLATEVAAVIESREENIEIKQEIVVAKNDDSNDDVKNKVLDLVSQKTGYPIDMLDLDLDLEADLGVDTVKQAEIFATIRESYQIPRDENRKLRDFPTLSHVINFVYSNRPDLKTKPTDVDVVKQRAIATIVEEVKTETTQENDEVKNCVLNLVAEKTGYPIDMLDLDLDLEADLGVDTVKQAEIFATIRESYQIPRDENRKLRDFPTLSHVINFVYSNRPDLKFETTTNNVIADSSISQTSTNDADDEVKNRVLNLVAEKTGYPIDMLDLDLDLEADLGVDTVKQAEIFATIRESYQIPRDENRKLRDFPTLSHVINFVYSNRPDLKFDSNSVAESQQNPISSETNESVIEKSLTSKAVNYDIAIANSIARRMPCPILRPPLNLCKQTKVELNQNSRVLIMPDEKGVAQALIEQLQARHVEILLLDSSLDSLSLKARLEEWLSTGAISGVYWLAALDQEADINDMSLSDWHKALEPRIKNLYETMRLLYEQIISEQNFLITAVRLGGMHGYDELGAYAPMGGATVGFTKAYKREKPDVLVKAVDFQPNEDPKLIASLLIAETERDNGIVEVGYHNGLRWSVGLKEIPLRDEQTEMVLGKDSVFVITGAAGSIVSAITTDLANASGGIFYLLDLVPKPDENNSDLIQFQSDKEVLKREIFERLKLEGEKATPAMVEKELAKLERAYAALAAIKAIENAGGQAHYFSVDLKDYTSINNVIEQIRTKHQKIDVLMHAAGLEISRFLNNKERSEFDLVFDVKSDGWFNLIHSIGDMPLGATVVFSSIAGRFGNGGQTDYSAANDLLCKYISNLNAKRPETQNIAIDWTAWAEIGMATRGSIPKMMAMAGIDMLPPDVGIPTVRRELIKGGKKGEIIAAKELGILMNEWDANGGIDTNINLDKSKLMIEKITHAGLYQGLSSEVTLDPKEQPFLYDHKIDGTAVLPGVMGLEAFAEIATLPLKDWHIVAIEKVEFLSPFKFYRDEPRTIKIQAQFYPDKDNTIVAECCLIGSRKLPNNLEAQLTTHFRAKLRLSKTALTQQTAIVPEFKAMVGANDIYQFYFHGPAYQVLENVCQNGAIIGLMADSLPANHQPSQLETTIAPRLIELCFQSAGIWEIATTGKLGLPAYIESITPFTKYESSSNRRLYAVIHINNQGESFDAQVVNSQGELELDLKGYQTIALPNLIREADRLKIKAAMA